MIGSKNSGNDRTEFVFDEVTKIIDYRENDISMMKKILENYKFDGKSVLEVGSGLGDNLIYCARNGASYAEGFDISLKNIKIANSKIKDLPTVYFHKCSIEDYKTEKKFDIILAIAVFEYFGDPYKALRKICSLLKDKGTVIMLVSKPILLKRIFLFFGIFFSKVSSPLVLSTADILDRFFSVFKIFFEKKSYVGRSRTYSIKRLILEGLMVKKYTIPDLRIFHQYMKEEGFLSKIIDDICPSMTCIIAEK